jgi:hypothetical protein
LETLNTTETSQGLNQTTFKANKLLLEKQCTKVVHNKKNILQMPSNVILEPANKICQKTNSWIFQLSASLNIRGTRSQFRKFTRSEVYSTRNC